MRPAALMLLSCFALALCSMHGAAQRKKEEPPKGDAPAASDFEAKEIASAKKLVAALKGNERAIYDAVRFMMRPKFQDELFAGRSYRPCALAPFEAEAKGELSLDEKLRLNALLAVGLPLSPAIQSAADRLADSPLPQGTMLGHCALELLILRDLAAFQTLQNRDKLLLRAQNVIKAADNAATATARPDNQPDFPIPARWFFNHFWRQAIARLACELGLPFNQTLASSDLEALLKTHDKERGYNGGGPATYSSYYDGDSNYIALAAISLAAEAPDRVTPRARKAALLKQLEAAPALLKKFATTVELNNDASVSLLRASMQEKLAPEGEKDPEAWRTRHIEKLLESQQRNGGFAPRGTRAPQTGWVATLAAQDGGPVLETVLVLNVLAGGLFAEKRPLKNVKADDLAKILRALALLDAARSRVVSPVFRERVINAIADGCAFLASTQKEDGSFPSHYSHLSGQQALILLTLLHGGAERDSAPIKKGLAFLEKMEFRVSSVSYDAAIILMFFQKYYEAEIKAAGMLGIASVKDWQAARKKLVPTLPPQRVQLFARLVADLDGAYTGGEGGFGYTKIPQTSTTEYKGSGDSSNTQYAMLGYRAASMLGCEIKTEVFKREAERLTKTFFAVDLEKIPSSFHRRGAPNSPDKSAPPKVPMPDEFKDLNVEPGGWGYGCTKGGPDFAMTAAGGSSLSICMDELRLRGALDEKLEREINRRVAGALMYIRHEYYVDDSCRAVHAATGGAPLWDGCGFFYNLYSTERCCELLKVRDLPENFDWYRVGADLLCYSQDLDGSWQTDNVPQKFENVPGKDGKPAHNEAVPQAANICMAILFLKRAAMPIITDHRKFDKSKPREDDDPAKAPPKKPITGEKEKPAEPGK